MTAVLLLNKAYELHYAKRFAEACTAYHELLHVFPAAYESESARRQLVNLRDFDVAGATSHSASAAKQGRNRGDLQGDEGRR